MWEWEGREFGCKRGDGNILYLDGVNTDKLIIIFYYSFKGENWVKSTQALTSIYEFINTPK